MVPSSIIIGSVLKGVKTVYGKGLVPIAEVPAPKRRDILKSLILNELLVVLSLFYHSPTVNATKMAMDASKWTIHAASYLVTGESKSLEDSMEVLFNGVGIARHLERFGELRKRYRNDLSFSLSALGTDARVHLFLLAR